MSAQFQVAFGVPRICSRLLRRLVALSLSRLFKGWENNELMRARAASSRESSTPGST